MPRNDKWFLKAVSQANSLHYWHRGLDVIEPSETQHREDAVQCLGHATTIGEDDSRFSLTKDGSDCHIKKHYLFGSRHWSWTHLRYSRPETVITLFLSTATALYHSPFLERRNCQVLDPCVRHHACILWHHKDMLDKLQSILNAPADLVCKLRKFDHITATLQADLCWLILNSKWTLKLASSRTDACMVLRCYAGDQWSRSSSHPFCSLWLHCCTVNKHQNVRPMKFRCKMTSHLEWTCDLYAQQ